MADGPVMLLVLSGIMAMSSFLAGILPLSISLSQRQLRIMTAVGSGLLIGTALVIIIPEGVEALYADRKANGHSVVGVTLVLGFALMYLIDVLPPLLLAKAASESHLPLIANGVDSQPLTPLKPSNQHSHTHATTIGLVIHSFADGIALGASSTSPSIGLVVFAAIMLHKAPAAFGLTTALLKQGLNKRSARTHLLLFSLAAPMGAFVTWAIVCALAGKGVDGSNEFWTGVALVFSGGTFLYVAMHSMQSSSAGSVELSSSEPQKVDVRYTFIGMLLPLLTQLGHRHAHAH